LALAGALHVIVAAASHAAPAQEQPNFDAELGGIVALLPVVDVRPDEMAAVKVAKTSILDQVLKALAGEGLKVISEDDALKSMTRVGVLHVIVGATVDEKSQQAVKVEVEIRRRALVDCCKYVPLVHLLICLGTEAKARLRLECKATLFICRTCASSRFGNLEYNLRLNLPCLT
jgi:hypothetical protein